MILIGALATVNLWNSSLKPAGFLCLSLFSEDDEYDSDERPTTALALITHPDSPVPGRKKENPSENAQPTLECWDSSQSIPGLQDGEGRRGNKDDGDDPQPPIKPALLCKICKTRQTSPGETCCSHCLSAQQNSASSSGATIPVCVRCNTRRDGRMISGEWVCENCIVPTNDLLGEAGIYGLNECMICMEEEDLQPLFCGHRLMIHQACLDQTAKGMVRCAQCQKMVSLVEVESSADEQSLSVNSIREVVAATQDNIPVGNLEHEKKIELARRCVDMLKTDGIRVSVDDILNVFHANAWLTPSVALQYIPVHFAGLQRSRPRQPFRLPGNRDRKCSIQ